eukprot:8216779-Alexandrium_andersonii.AAC.1
MERPVHWLRKALYGRPNVGAYWGQKCDGHVRSVGFMLVGETWPSCYCHDKLKLFLVIYVDDFKLAGPAGPLADDWKLLRKGLPIEPEQRCD